MTFFNNYEVVIPLGATLVCSKFDAIACSLPRLIETVTRDQQIMSAAPFARNNKHYTFVSHD